MLRALFDFGFTRQGGPAIVRTLYGLSLVLLTTGLVALLLIGIKGLDMALGNAEQAMWNAFLAGLLPVYFGTLLVNRLFAELCLAVLRIANATERP